MLQTAAFVLAKDVSASIALKIILSVWNLIPFALYYLVARNYAKSKNVMYAGFLLVTLHSFYLGLYVFELVPEWQLLTKWLPLYEVGLTMAAAGANFLVERLKILLQRLLSKKS